MARPGSGCSPRSSRGLRSWEIRPTAGVRPARRCAPPSTSRRSSRCRCRCPVRCQRGSPSTTSRSTGRPARSAARLATGPRSPRPGRPASPAGVSPAHCAGVAPPPDVAARSASTPTRRSCVPPAAARPPVASSTATGAGGRWWNAPSPGWSLTAAGGCPTAGSNATTCGGRCASPRSTCVGCWCLVFATRMAPGCWPELRPSPRPPAPQPRLSAVAHKSSERCPRNHCRNYRQTGPGIFSRVLAVDVAGAALAVQQGLISYADFLTNLAQPDEDELELILELADALPNGHEPSITRTLQRSISHISADGHDFIRLAASLAPGPIPAGVVAAVFAQADRLDQQPAIRRAGRAIAEAAAFSLTSKAGDDQTGAWLIHALVARTIRFQEPDPQRLAVLREAAVATLTAQLQAIVDARAHIALEGVIPHARQLVGDAETAMEAELLGWVARYDHQRGDFGPAAQGYRQQADAYRQLLGPEHPATLTAMSNLALTQHSLGDLTAALELNQQVLDARRRLLGPEHPHT